jgi:hypothetical protein
LEKACSLNYFNSHNEKAGKLRKSHSGEQMPVCRICVKAERKTENREEKR